MKRVLTKKYRKAFTSKAMQGQGGGNIIKVLEEQYISKMPCGVSTCQQCETNMHTNLQFRMSGVQEAPRVVPEGGIDDSEQDYNIIYILDDNFVANQIDLIDHFEALDNCVILKSTHENILNTRMGGSHISSLVKWNTIQEKLENSR